MEAAAVNGGMKAVPGPVVQIDDRHIQAHLDEVVRSTVEETLNALLDAEADRLCGARKYERTEGRKDPRAGSYDRHLQTNAGEVTLTVPKLRTLPFETAIIERYRRRESSVEGTRSGTAMVDGSVAGGIGYFARRAAQAAGVRPASAWMDRSARYWRIETPSLPFRPSIASMATRMRICGVIWISGRPLTRRGSGRQDPPRSCPADGGEACPALLPAPARTHPRPSLTMAPAPQRRFARKSWPPSRSSPA